MICMPMNCTFTEIAREDLLKVAQARHEEGCRFVQMLCTATETGIDLVYTFMREGEGCAYELENVQISGIDPKVDEIPSVTEYFLSAFPFENEAHDLFGVNVKGIAIDFAGGFYKVAMDSPMTVISPAQKAAREKAAKIAAAKAAKVAAAKAAAEARQARAKALLRLLNLRLTKRPNAPRWKKRLPTLTWKRLPKYAPLLRPR